MAKTQKPVVNMSNWTAGSILHDVIVKRCPYKTQYSPHNTSIITLSNHADIHAWAEDVEKFCKIESIRIKQFDKNYIEQTTKSLTGWLLYQNSSYPFAKIRARRYNIFKRAPYFFWNDTHTITAWFVGKDDLVDASQFARFHWHKFTQIGLSNYEELKLKNKIRHFWHAFKLEYGFAFEKRYSIYHLADAWYDKDTGGHLENKTIEMLKQIQRYDYPIDYSEVEW